MNHSNNTVTNTVVKREFTVQHRANLSDAARMRIAAGKVTARTRTVTTPLGTFSSCVKAANAHKITRQLMYHWLQDSRKPDFYYQNKV
jgi:hypothetical protein